MKRLSQNQSAYRYSIKVCRKRAKKDALHVMASGFLDLTFGGSLIIIVPLFYYSDSNGIGFKLYYSTITPMIFSFFFRKNHGETVRRSPHYS